MDDGFDVAFEQRGQQRLRVADVGLDESETLCRKKLNCLFLDGARLERTEVVDSGNAMTVMENAPSEVSADESGTSYENVHCRS